jgi:small subunit ribosomal protein S16
MRIGKKGQPAYRIVVQEAWRKTGGIYLESLGHFRPQQGKGEFLQVNLEKVQTWQARGASTSKTVRALLKRARASATA